jgi:methyltransferase
VSAGLLIVILVALQRAAELALAERNTRALLARGAREAGRGHYPAIVALHLAWLAGLAWLAPGRPIRWAWIGVFLVLQAARIWVIASLGRRWTTRIIVLPGAPLVRRGPYRLLRHPNYLVVVAELAALPLAFGLRLYAAAFLALAAVILAVRIRAEEKALQNPSPMGRRRGPPAKRVGR